MEVEDFWLEYVDARGELHGGPLEVMWSTRLEAAGQVRTFPSYRGQRSFPGWYWAATGAELVGYESWVELGQLMRLDCDPGVVAMASQPFRLSWRSGDRARRISHTPDYFVHRRDGTGVVLDVRPDDRIEPEEGLCSERWNSVGFIQRRPAVSRPSKVMSKAWSAAFQRMVQRLRPVPVGSRLMTAR